MVEPVAGEWIHPVPGSPEAEAGRAFEWTPVPGASEYRLVIGTGPVSTDLLDRIVGKRTRVKVEDLPVGRRLFARVYTRTRDTWYWRDADFAIRLGYRGASPIHPQPGGIAESLSAVPVAARAPRHRLSAPHRIEPRRLGAPRQRSRTGRATVRGRPPRRSQAPCDAHDRVRRSVSRAALRVPRAAWCAERKQLRGGGAGRHGHRSGHGWTRATSGRGISSARSCGSRARAERVARNSPTLSSAR